MHNWHSILGAISGIMAMLAVIPYIRDIFKGQTRPNIFSWALWVLLLSISIAAQVSAGASWSLYLLIGDLIGTSTIFFLCISGYGYKEYGRVEWICTALAIIAIVSWQITSQPVLAIIFSVIADSLASVPTIIKAYKDPSSEHSAQWLIIASAAVLAVISTTIWDASNLIFPIYLFLVNGSIGLISLIRGKSTT
ncbi:hypothetical protein KW800_02470 [Candidatus Parcubacteria bacterium]|nr:hypothetical protein [Candidatus Parcubacteria bacterium]